MCDSGDFACRVEARARRAFEAEGGAGWEDAGDGQLPWIVEAREAELVENPEGSMDAQIAALRSAVPGPDGLRVTE